MSGNTDKDGKDKGVQKSSSDAPVFKRYRVHLQEKSTKLTERTSNLTKQTDLLHTEQPGFLQPEGELEQTFQVRQSQIRSQVDRATSAKASFHLDLSSTNLSPYTTAVFSRSSRSLLVASRKGHISVCNWRNATLQCELHLNETIRSATFLHNDSFFATAQKEHAFIYDSSGAQVHVMRNHREPGAIVSLPHHLLLATVSAPSMPHSRIVYTDTSTGEVVGHHDFSQRSLSLTAAPDACVNLANGVLHVAHNSGAVSLWSPTSPRPLARVFCHGGGVRQVAVFPGGDAMATTGADGLVKLTDLRTFRTLTSWQIPTSSSALAVSQRRLVAIGFGANVQVWTPSSSSTTMCKTTDAPYMRETFSGKRVTGLGFCPFEDILSVCHNNGMCFMIVPGAGEATFDTSAPNPYETRKQRRENEVRSLLDKLPASTIALDPSFVGSLDRDPRARLREIEERERLANIAGLRNKRIRKKAKGRSKISKRIKKKENNVIDAKRLEMEEELNDRRKTIELAKRIQSDDAAAVAAGSQSGTLQSSLPTALNRFLPRK